MLGRHGILAWEGVAGPDGRPLPVTPDSAAAFATHPVMRTAFVAAYNATLRDQAAEGNGSATSPVGGTDEAQNTVEGAGQEKEPEGSQDDAAAAPTSSTGRARTKAKAA